MTERLTVLREEEPIYWSEESEIWIITRYRDLEFISKHQEFFTSEFGIRAGTSVKAGLIDEGEPRHSFLRGKIGRGFTPRMVKKLEIKFREMVTTAIDKIANSGECDFVEAVSKPLPILLIADMMGVPQVDHKQYADWSDTLVAADGNYDDPDILAKSGEALVEYGAYMRELIEAKRKDPADDLISILLSAKDDGLLTEAFTNERTMKNQTEEFNDLASDELIMLLVVLMIAGNETTRNGISGGMQLLIENPAERQKLIDDPSLIPGAVEEMLRLVTPVKSFGRTLTQDYEFGGKQLKKGQMVCMMYGPANRDPDVIEDPDAFRVERRPHHLALGVGPHFCLGASLARMELRVVFEEILRRLPDIEYSRGGPEFTPSALVRACSSMWVRYTPAG